MPNLRLNIISGDWVVIAPERAKRPEDFVQEKKTEKEPVNDCPFCVSNNSAYETRISETENIYIIPNKFPAFVPEDVVLEQGGELYPSYKSLGYHEVVIIKNHKIDLQKMSVSLWDELLYNYQKRLVEHYKNPCVEYSLIIHNHGDRAGASIAHPHSQIMASAIIPSAIERELENSQKYFKRNDRCVFCDLVNDELKTKERLIFENEHFLATTAYAARFPFEVWVMPKSHQSDFVQMDKDARIQLGQIMGRVFASLDQKLKDPDYNFYIHTAPPRQGDPSAYYHWHIEILPRLTDMGGYELGTADFIDVVSPEKAALFLKN